MRKNKDKKDLGQYKERKRLLFLGLPFTFTKYIITKEKLTVKEGFLNQKTDYCYTYKIQDSTLRRSLMERVFGLGTITCNTGDVTHPTLILKHIKHSEAIHCFIFEQSESARLQRRTINTLDISANKLENDTDIVEL